MSAQPFTGQGIRENAENREGGGRMMKRTWKKGISGKIVAAAVAIAAVIGVTVYKARH